MISLLVYRLAEKVATGFKVFDDNILLGIFNDPPAGRLDSYANSLNSLQALYEKGVKSTAC